jgi:hypothetical protein
MPVSLLRLPAVRLEALDHILTATEAMRGQDLARDETAIRGKASAGGTSGARPLVGSIAC